MHFYEIEIVVEFKACDFFFTCCMSIEPSIGWKRMSLSPFILFLHCSEVFFRLIRKKNRAILKINPEVFKKKIFLRTERQQSMGENWDSSEVKNERCCKLKKLDCANWFSLTPVDTRKCYCADRISSLLFIIICDKVERF